MYIYRGIGCVVFEMIMRREFRDAKNREETIKDFAPPNKSSLQNHPLWRILIS